MIRYAKAISANTDLFSAQSFIFERSHFILGLLISGSGEDVFIKIKQAVLELENEIVSETPNIASDFTRLANLLHQKLVNIDNLQILLSSWKADLLYIQSFSYNNQTTWSLEAQRDQTATLEPQNLPNLPEDQLPIPHPQAFLLRQSRVLNLTPEKTHQLISGHIKPGDSILLTTPYLLEFLEFIKSKDSALELLLSSSPEVIQDDLNALILDHPQSKPQALILLQSLDQPQSIPKPPRKPLQMPKLTLPIPRLNPLPYLHLTSRKQLFIIIISLIGLIIGIILVSTQLFTPNIETPPAQLVLIDQAQEKLNLANREAGVNPTQAKIYLQESQDLLAQAAVADPANPQITQLKTEIQNTQNRLSNSIPITDWPVFLSLNLIKANFDPERLSYSVGKLLLLDKKQKSLVLLDTITKNNQILAGPTQMGSVTLASLNGDFAFSYSPDKGVARIDTPTKKATPVTKPDPEWGSITDIYAFASNVYLLDAGKNAVWKYTPVVSGYSDRLPYFKEGVVAYLSDARLMQIDSSVWILKGVNEILKYTSGSQDFFAFSNLDQPVKQISSLYVSSDTENLYAIDQGNSRLLVLDKKGAFISQYTGEKFATAKDLVVDEETKKIYLLEGDKIYQLELK